MKHLGDITKILGAEAPPVNVIIGGSPCQDLSVAGKRAGLAGERSGLFMEQIRIIKEMRNADVARGRTGKDIRPRFMVWENVPGAFSSNKGADFGAVLQETIRVVCEAPAVPMPNKGWPLAGCLYGEDGGWSLAWRVFDAQFWGVPQRRRRIALVADFGGTTAPEILFERKGVSGYYPSGGTPWEAFTSGPQRGPGKTGYCIPINDKATRFNGGGATRHNDGAGNGLGVGMNGDPSPTLTAGDRHAVFSAGFNYKMGAKAAGIGFEEEKAPTLSANRPDASVISVAENQQAEIRLSDKCNALSTGGASPDKDTPACCNLRRKRKWRWRNSTDYDRRS